MTANNNALAGADEVRWPPRVTKERLRRLYATEAAGLLDKDLLDEVGITLYLRCLAILDVYSALHRGMIRCPRCQQAGRAEYVQREQPSRRNPNPIVRCSVCGWETDWVAYQRTFRRRQLNAGGATEYSRRLWTTTRAASRRKSACWPSTA